MLLGTNKKLSSNIHELAVYYGEHHITDTISYVYLGHTVKSCETDGVITRSPRTRNCHEDLHNEDCSNPCLHGFAEAVLNCYTEGQPTLTGEKSFDNHDTKSSFH